MSILDTLNYEIDAANKRDQDHFDEAFTNPITNTPYKIPANLRHLSERICRSYGIDGICDPMYLANIIALELGLGDGQSNFLEATHD